MNATPSNASLTSGAARSGRTDWSRPWSGEVRGHGRVSECPAGRAVAVAEPAAAGLPLVAGSAKLKRMEAPLKRITVDPQVCQGQPCIRGLRIPVSVVLRYLADGKTSGEVVDEFPELEPEDVAECLRYAAWLASGRAIELPPAA